MSDTRPPPQPAGATTGTPSSNRTYAPPRRRPYDRLRDLPALLPLWPDELADVSLAGRLRLLARLRRALRSERARGRAGHWSYDLARHAALHAAYRREVADAMALVAPRRASLATVIPGTPAAPSWLVLDRSRVRTPPPRP